MNELAAGRPPTAEDSTLPSVFGLVSGWCGSVADARLGPTEEDPAIDLNALVSPYFGLTVMVLAVLLAFTMIGLVLQNRRVTSLEVRLLRLTRGSEDGNLQDVLESHLDTVARVVDDVDVLAARSAMLEDRSHRAFQRIGLVRFNPFEDTGGNQSFALALLDGSGDGIVISSLHTRSATRVYAKTVSDGRCDGGLSDEESRALELARSPLGRRAVDGAIEPRLATPSSAGSAGAGPATPGGPGATSDAIAHAGLPAEAGAMFESPPTAVGTGSGATVARTSTSGTATSAQMDANTSR